MAVLMVLIFIVTLYVMESTNWQRNDIVFGGKILREITYPFQRGAQTIANGFASITGYFKDNKALREENEALQKLLVKQASQLLELQDIKKENERLSALLEYKSSHSEQYRLIAAQVIGREPTNWYQTVIINQGSNDGIRTDMPVITPAGLVGRIIAVTPNTSEVLLLIDNESAVGARILETRITPGVVQGAGQSKMLEMIHLSHDESINVGNTVITSGFSSIFPKGLLIGTVEEVEVDSNTLTKTAYIKPFVDFDRLEEVMIITEVLKEDTLADEALAGQEETLNNETGGAS